jgi:hypothetical protein
VERLRRDQVDRAAEQLGQLVLEVLDLPAETGTVILPGERRQAAGDAAAAKRVELGGTLATLLFLVLLYLMIWKPGL